MLRLIAVAAGRGRPSPSEEGPRHPEGDDCRRWWAASRQRVEQMRPSARGGVNVLPQ
jgi:hypothetical protein